MDNRTLDVVSEGDKALAMALTLIWPNAAGGKATHYRTATLAEQVTYSGNPTTMHHSQLVPSPEGKETLILLWSAEREAQPLPYPLDLEGAIQFVKGWLKNASYGQKPGHDGDNGFGFRVFTEQWGHVAGYHYGIAGIQPAWAMYGN